MADFYIELKKLREPENAHEQVMRVREGLRASPFFAYLPDFLDEGGTKIQVLEDPDTIENKPSISWRGRVLLQDNEFWVLTGYGAPDDEDEYAAHETFHIAQARHARDLIEPPISPVNKKRMIGQRFVSSRLCEIDGYTKQDLFSFDRNRAREAKAGAPAHKKELTDPDKFLMEVLAILPKAMTDTKNSYYSKLYVYHFMKKCLESPFRMGPSYDMLIADPWLMDAVRDGTWPLILKNDYPLLRPESIRRLCIWPNSQPMDVSDNDILRMREMAIMGFKAVNLGPYNNIPMRPQKQKPGARKLRMARI